MSQYIIQILLFFHVGILFFHLGVLLRFIPYMFIWGGKIQSDEQMAKMEVVSIIIALFFISILVLASGLVNNPFSGSMIKFLMIFMALFYFVGTIMNLISKNKVEKYFFSVLSLSMCLLSIFCVVNN